MGLYPSFPWRKFYSLSLKDLLEARDLYHHHLINKKNVVATAVGLYLFRANDPELVDDYAASRGNAAPDWPDEEKPLDKVRLRPYSWPCILVFVKEWIHYRDFYRDDSASPEDMVPSMLYMPDGRIVSVCVVKAPACETEKEPVNLENLIFPDEWVGGGFPVIKKIQGEERVASIGCLVTDGNLIYALTNRHVSGTAGEEVYTIRRGELIRIGKSSEKQLSRSEFSKVYHDWPGKNVFVNLDVGLIEIEDIDDWTAQIYGIGRINEMADLYCNTISLDLVGETVRAFGCASHQMAGEIKGLFYRYKSIGGFEYVTEFFIGPGQPKERTRKSLESPAEIRGEAETPFWTRHGDSGTVWLLDAYEKNQKPIPIAIQWGGQIFANSEGGAKTPYALASCLSTVCNLLEVDILCDLNTGLDEYWGGMGHYTIGTKACDMISNSKLKLLMENNRNRISFYEQDIISDINLDGLSKMPFVPLADVPDLVWKARKGKYFRPWERVCHYADMDKPDKDGRTLFELCKSNLEQNVDIDVWREFYKGIEETDGGILPFRVWQIYKCMVDYVKKGQVAEFVTASGILAHYVGDACNPLHLSFKHDGDPGVLVPPPKKKKNVKNAEAGMQPKGKGVHSMYENNMIKLHTIEIVDYINRKIGSGIEAPGQVKGGKEAAISVINLMCGAYEMISPDCLIDAYDEIQSKRSRRDAAHFLWNTLGKKTCELMYMGCRCLASLWENAWIEGNGDVTAGDLSAVGPDEIRSLYLNAGFLPSLKINEFETVL